MHTFLVIASSTRRWLRERVYETKEKHFENDIAKQKKNQLELENEIFELCRLGDTREEYAIGKESFRKQRKEKKYENQTIEQQSKQAANKRKKKLHYHFLCVFKPMKHQNLELRGI